MEVLLTVELPLLLELALLEEVEAETEEVDADREVESEVLVGEVLDPELLLEVVVVVVLRDQV